MLQHRMKHRQHLMPTGSQSDFLAFPCSEQPLGSSALNDTLLKIAALFSYAVESPGS
jgi:hypothetical protein